MRSSMAAFIVFAVTQLILGILANGAYATEKNQPLISTVFTYDSSRSDAAFTPADDFHKLVAKGKTLGSNLSVRVFVASTLSSEQTNESKMTSLDSARTSFLRALRLRDALAEELGTNVKIEILTQGLDGISPEGLAPNTARIDFIY